MKREMLFGDALVERGPVQPGTRHGLDGGVL